MILWVSASYEFVCARNRNELISCSPADVVCGNYLSIIYATALPTHKQYNNLGPEIFASIATGLSNSSKHNLRWKDIMFVTNEVLARQVRSSGSAQFDSDKRRIGFGRNSGNRIARPGTQIIRAPKLANFVNPIKEVKNKAEPQLAVDPLPESMEVLKMAALWEQTR